MLIRIVKMEFKPEKVPEFLEFFEQIHQKIEAFPGCSHVELCGDPEQQHIFYTFSKWQQPEDLEQYRNSEFFQETWSKTKRLFGGKPMAHSLIQQ